MRKYLLLVTSLILVMVLAACSAPEGEEVLDFHNAAVDEINPKLEEFGALVAKIDLAQSPEEIISLYDDEIIPLIGEVKAFYEEQGPFEYDAAKDYLQTQLELANAMYDGVLKEKEYYIALFDDAVSEEEFAEVEAELIELTQLVEEKDTAVGERWEALKEEYNFIEEDEE